MTCHENTTYFTLVYRLTFTGVFENTLSLGHYPDIPRNQPIKSQIDHPMDHPSLKWVINHFGKWIFRLLEMSDSKSSSKWLRDSRSLMNQSDWSWADTLPEAKHLHNISEVLKSPRASGRSSSERTISAFKVKQKFKTEILTTWTLDKISETLTHYDRGS